MYRNMSGIAVAVLSGMVAGAINVLVLIVGTAMFGAGLLLSWLLGK